MQIIQKTWHERSGWAGQHSPIDNPQLVLIFGATAILREPMILASIRADFPGALIFGCSTAGEIHGTRVSDGSLT